MPISIDHPSQRKYGACRGPLFVTWRSKASSDFKSFRKTAAPRERFHPSKRNTGVFWGPRHVAGLQGEQPFPLAEDNRITAANAENRIRPSASKNLRLGYNQ
jgi:hypothetical protein